ncbi:hypothetical protein DYB34_004676 [Aphanomyces astaci]|uniref:Transposase Tc1-like domain-containing protein n=1 Tax=Aphanomyces astaci TaxID=112090 RepID=A0A3R6W6U8_APHAT|nr:hypothetical protein DYB34_004676 [Aphanomyces astaci]
METPRVRRELSYENKMEVVTRLQKLTIMGKLVRGAISTTAKHMQLHRTTVSNVWEGFKRNSRMSSGKLGRVGGKKINTSSIVSTLVSEVPEEQRSTMRDISQATGLSMGTLSRRLKDGTIERKNTRLKPLLTDANTIERTETPPEVTYEFDAMWDVAVMRLVLEHNGSNHFPLSHLKKDAKRRAGTLSANLSCPASLLG